MIAREYSEPALGDIHRLTVDAYAAQHPGRPSPQSMKSVGVHLIRLCLAVEQGFDVRESKPDRGRDLEGQGQVRLARSASGARRLEREPRGCRVEQRRASACRSRVVAIGVGRVGRPSRDGAGVGWEPRHPVDLVRRHGQTVIVEVDEGSRSAVPCRAMLVSHRSELIR